MVLTHSTTKKFQFQGLPTELQIEVIQAASQADQAALCRVSKQLQSLSLPILNRDVHVSNQHVEEFCLGIIRSPERASAVRGFTVTHKAFVFSEECLNSMYAALGLMDGLEDLKLFAVAFRHNHDARLYECTFPHLRIFSVVDYHLTDGHDESRTGRMASFLARHQTLRCLYLSAQTYSFLPTTSSVTAHLPNLEHYEGPALLVPALRLSTTKLRSTRLRWAAMHKSSIDGIVRALHASTTSDGGPFIFSHRCLVTNTRADYMAILVSVARYMPHIGTLQICVDHVVPIGQDAVEKITEHLPRFDRLQYISFVVMRRVVPPEPNRAELGGGLPHPHGLPSPWVRVAETGRSLGNV